MKYSEIKTKSGAELKKLLAESKEELFHLGLKKATGQLEKIHRVKVVKKTIARVLTLINQKKMEASS